MVLAPVLLKAGGATPEWGGHVFQQQPQMILVLAAAAVMSANGRRVTNVDLEGSLSRNLVVDHGTKRIEHEHARNRRIETLHSTRGYDLSALQAMSDDELVEKLHEHERNGRVETLRSAHGYDLAVLQAMSDDELVELKREARSV